MTSLLIWTQFRHKMQKLLLRLAVTQVKLRFSSWLNTIIKKQRS